jgi:hypothetical protein
MKSKMLIVGLLFGAISCGPSKLITKSTIAKQNDLEVTKPGVLIKPLLADLEVTTERKSVVYKGQTNLSIADLKNNAMQLFLETNKCEYVLDPIFTINKTVENKKLTAIEIKLTGLSATYKKIYHVDSLPKSIGQYTKSLNPLNSNLNYYNSIEEVQDNTGVDLMYGNYVGIQIDKPLSNNQSVRIYVAGDYLSEAAKAAKADYLFKTDTLKAQPINGGVFNQFNFSIGASKEFIFMPKVSFRLLGGLNYAMYSTENKMEDAFVSINHLGSVGLRLGAAIDLKLASKLYLVGKFHTNLGLLNLAFASDINENTQNPINSVKNITFDGLQTSYIGAGLRFLF